MFIALTANNEKISIEDSVPGESYFCPVCGNPVIVRAARSENIRTHFAHKRNSMCLDNWKHDMSEWHFGWQSKFPIENREIVVEKDGEIHRADILINDTVIEFQHSPISSEEFEERNNFYKSCGYRVVWLFDAAGKIKDDECFGLVWKRMTTLFSSMRTPIDGFFIQNYLPGKADLLCISRPDPKEIMFHRTIYPIMPSNFLKEFGAIQDESALSIQAIFKITQKANDEEKRLKRELEARRRRAMANAAFDHPLRRNGRRRGRF